jgi:hypothetical protein
MAEPGESVASAIRSVLCDLDGTFADAAPDLADALNETLRRTSRTTKASGQAQCMAPASTLNACHVDEHIPTLCVSPLLRPTIVLAPFFV